jgi:putative ABC transport system permease protein
MSVRSGNVSPVDVVDWRAQARTLAGIATINSSTMAFSGTGEPDVIRAGVASANFFELLGVRPVLGRAFRPEEEIVGRHRVALLAHDTWRGRFGADPAVVGRTITLAGFAYQIIGVLPPGFEDPRGGAPPELWRPLALNLTPEARGGHFLQAIGRLAPAATLRGAQAEMDAITARLAQEYPATNTDRGVRLVQLHDAVAADVRRPLLVLLAAVGLLLVIACVNVANLVLVRAGARTRELGVRTALGAARGALVRQLLVEHALLAGAGGALGLVLAEAMGRGLATLSGGLLPQLARAQTDGAVVAFAIGISALTVLAFGMAPALGAARVDVRAALMEGGRGATAGRRARRARVVLAGVQLALSFVLLSGAGLLVKSFARLAAVDAGFAREGVLTFALALSGDRYADENAVREFHRAFLERVEALPATRAAGFVDRFPLSGSYSCDSFGLGDRPAPAEGQEPCAEYRLATPGYFAAMGIPLLSGRGLDERDRADAPPVVVVNATMARRYWPDADPLGKPFAWGSAGPDAEWRTIVGTVGDVRHFGLDQEIRAEVYVPAAQSAATFAVYAVRATGDPRALAPAIRALVRELDPDLPVRDLRPIDDVVRASVAAPRLRTVLLGTFALLALALAAVGVYGVLAYGVGQRTGEIGVRMALGAREREILVMVLRQGLGVAGIAVAAGLLGTLWATPALGELLFDVSPADPAVLGAVAAFLLMTAALAGYFPARRAARTDPMEALRHE